MADDKKDKAPKETTIHIDKKVLKSPDPTTGAALYVLGNVGADYELFREVHGQGEDEPVPNDATPIDLKNGEKFYTAQRTLNPGA